MSRKRKLGITAWFEFFTEHSSTPALLAQAGRILAANPAMSDFLGINSFELAALFPLAKLLPPEDFAAVVQFADSPPDPTRLFCQPTHVVLQDESKREVNLEAWASEVDDSTYLLIRLLINHSAEATHNLQRVHRSIQMLIAISHNLVHVSEVQPLLQEACRICVEDAGYAMAWIGYAEDGKGKPIRPRASAGLDEKYFDNLRFSWTGDEQPYGNDPTGTAVRTRSTCVMHDLLNNPLYVPWREAARQRGYNSAVALPLLIDASTVGVLTICDAEPEAFGIEEIELLEELVRGLEFAIRFNKMNLKRQAAKEDLRKTYEFLAGVMDNAPMPVYVVNLAGRFVVVNKSWREVFNCQEPALDRFAPEVLVGAGNVAFFETARLAVVAQGLPVELEGILNLASGERAYFTYGFPLRDATGAITAVGGIAVDVSELKQAISALRQSEQALDVNAENLEQTHTELHESEARYRTMIEQAPDGISIVQDGIVIFANPAALEIHGAASSEDVLNRPVLELVPAEDHEYVAKQIAHLTKIGDVSELIEGRVLRTDGTHAYVEFRQSLILWHGKPALQVQMRDVTGRNKLEQQVRQMQKLEAVGVLASGIAHDFNNILSGILGYAEMAQDDLDPASITYDNLSEVIKAGLRAKDLVQQILTFSHKAETSRVPMSISPVVKEALKLLRASLPTTIEIKQTYAKADDTVLANPTELLQIVMNLCTNAAYAMMQAGTLEVSVRAIEVDADFARAHHGLQPGPHTVLSVADTGVGMAPATLEQIFDPFFTTKEPGEGTGLGLSVVYGIVRSMNGAIIVYSELGKGSAFHIYLPLVEGVVLSTSAAAPDRDTLRGTEHIMIVDDEPSLTQLAERSLVRLGYKVTVFSTGTAALAAFRTDPEQYAMLVTDQTMPGLTGMNLARGVMAIKPNFPVVLTSGFAHGALETEALLVGIREVIAKPIVPTKLAAVIRRYLDQ